MKVGINARTFSVSEPGGAVQASINLVRSLGRYDDVDLVLFGDESVGSEIPGALVDNRFCVSSQVYGLFWERTVLPRLCRDWDVDVLFCPNGNGPLTRQPFPVVMCIHDVNAQHGWSHSIHQIYRRVAIPLGARAADHITTVSKFSKREIIDTLNIRDENVSVVYNGIDEFYLSDGNEEAVDLPDRYILFVGAMNPRKNITGIIEAFNTLITEQDLPHSLVLIGPDNKSIFGDMNTEYSSDIYMPGFVTLEQLKYAYSHADLFVYPSFYEGFALPPLEALACGTPVVASRCGVLPEIENDVIEFVDPDDTQDIARGISDQIANPRSDELFKSTAAAFSWDEAAADLRDVLCSTIDEAY